jgi:biotin-dependent carboxylase-like uncharacterized protein
MTLRLRHAGACTLVVDGGRPHSRSLGVSLGGAADRAAWKIANALAGNPPTTAALEVALAGPTLQTDRPISLSLFGAKFTLDRDGRSLPCGAVTHLLPGQFLKVGAASRGMRAYLAVSGGIHSPNILDSQSSLFPLGADAALEVESVAAPSRSLAHAAFLNLIEMPETTPIRIVPGPQADWFDVNEFVSSRYTVSPSSNRMGMRLEGPALKRPSRELVSEAVASGAIQITNEGLPIVLGVDGQTIGGYPKIGYVTDADLDRLAQLRPRDEVRFELVSFEQAESIDHEYRELLQEWLMRLRIAEGLPARFPWQN